VKEPIELFTARYQSFRVGMGVPVRITLGRPRMSLKYDLQYEVKELAPSGSWFRASDEVFNEKFLEKLEKVGPMTLQKRFAQIAAEARVNRLVLLCFEDLAKPGNANYCHRELFADWWLNRVGEAVREIGEVYQPRPKAVQHFRSLVRNGVTEQGTLFGD
jgi:uncharacterized protein (DUF488 family)